MERMRPYPLALLLVLVSALQGQMQSPAQAPFGEISVEHGLPRISIRAIAQSPEGIMWFGLENAGLARYDGHSFEVFNESLPDGARLSDDNVEAICPDLRGFIWIGTARGLNRLDRDSGRIDWFRHDPLDPSSLNDDRIWALELDPTGRLWIGTDAGVCFLDQGSSKFVSVSPPEGRPPARTWDLQLDREGHVWAMTTEEAYKVDRATLETELLPYAANGLEPRRAYSAAQDHNGKLWFSTLAGYIVFDPANGAITDFPILNEAGRRMSGSPVATTDSHGRIWFGTFGDGLIIIEPEPGQYWIREEPVIGREDRQPFALRALTLDRDGRVWIGTKYHGLVFYHPAMETFKSWAATEFSADGNSAARPMSVAVDGRGAVWVGTHGEGITRIDPATGQKTRFPIAPHEVRAQCLEILPSGDVLFGGNRGVGSLDPETGEVRIADVGPVMDIQPGANGEIWLGARNGLFSLDLATFQATRAEDWSPATNALLAEMHCIALHLDDEGFLWVGSLDGSVYRLDREGGGISTLEDLASNDHPPILAARSFLSDSRGWLWMATKSSGLVRFDPRSREVSAYKTEAGFASKSAYGVLEDEEGMLWVSSDLGVCRFDPITKDVVCFGTQHGLQAEVFERNAQAKDSEGRLYFAGPNGVNVFRPEAISSKGAGGDLIFTELRILNKIRFRDRADVPPIQLRHDENQIMISFSLLDYNSAGRNQYAYRMSGLNDDWVDIGTRRTVSFNYLPPGSYTFEARARTPGSSWAPDSPSTLIKLSIAAPFWQTLPFRIAVISLALAALLGIYLTLHLRGKALRRRLERLVEERTGALQEANSELEAFAYSVSHDLRAPLRHVDGFVDLLAGRDAVVLDGKSQRYMKEISAAAKRMGLLIDDLLSFSRMGRRELLTAEVDVDALVKEIIRDSAVDLKDRNVEWRIEALPRVSGDRSMLRVVLVNLISNAIKFTRPRELAIIEIGSKRTGEEVEFHVKDNGVGYDSDYAEKLFGVFQRLHRDDEFEGTGIGLANVCRIIKRHGGRVWSESSLGHGATFYFSIRETK